MPINDNSTLSDKGKLLALLLEESQEENQMDTHRGILKADRTQPLPLSFTQERLWFLEQLKPGSSIFNLGGSLSITGPLDVPIILKCFQDVVDRHEVLRTTFQMQNGKPVQVVKDTLRIDIPHIDLTEMTPAAQDAELNRLYTKVISIPFDLEVGPLFRFALVKISATEHHLLTTIHHVVSDGWGMAAFTHDLSKFYEARVTHSAPCLEPIEYQYADFAYTQRQDMQGQHQKELLAYWKKRLADINEPSELPGDHPRPAIQSSNGGQVRLFLAKEQIISLRKLSRDHNSTLFMTMLAVFKLLIHRYTGRTDIVVGTPISQRDRVEMENLVGLFVNTLVLRTDLSGNPDFSTLLERVSDTCFEAFEHKSLPFERLVEELKPKRDPSRSPLCQIIFIYLNTPEAESLVDGLTMTPTEKHSGASEHDLSLYIRDRSDGKALECLFEYNTDLYSRSTIERLAKNYQHLLSSILEQPEQKISELPLLSSAETALLDSWNESAAPFPDTLCMHQLFEQHAQSQPDTDAVIFGEQRLSYAELNSRANQLAHYLREQGAGPDKIIAICLDRSIDMVISVLAILKSGSAYLALDPTYPSDRLAFMLEDSGVSLLLSTGVLASRLPAHQAKVIEVDKDPMSGQPDSNPDIAITPSNLAYVIYTSGSTGKPKGVMVEHHGWCNVAQFQTDVFNLVPGMRILQFASLSFDASAFEISMAWGCGGTLCLGTQEELLPGPNLENMLLNQSIEIVTLPPSALGAMPDAELPNLKVIMVAGDASSKELIQRWSKPGRRFFNLYGPTETTIWASYAECFSDLSGPPPIGKPIPNMQHYVVNKQMKRLPIGMPGELCIGGEGVTRGYLNRPELTAERFVPNPFSDSPGRLYRSGDLVRHLADGNLEFLGRIDHQVKIRGYRVELGEIESQLRQFVGVAEAVVVAHKAANGDQQLLAYVSPADSVELNRDALREHLRKALPAYMVPTQIQILDEMPLSSNGKVDRKALPSPESQAPEQVATIQTYQSEMEKVVSTVWQQILELETIDIHQNFFDLGGHSMKMAQVQTTLSQKLNRKVPLVDLFQYPTISTLAAHLEIGSAEQTTTKDTQRKSQQGSRGRMAHMASLNKGARKRT